MENYLDRLVEGYSCEQELIDSLVEMEVYLLQKKYGENWEEYASPDLLACYYDLQKRKNQSSSEKEEDSTKNDNENENGFSII